MKRLLLLAALAGILASLSSCANIGRTFNNYMGGQPKVYR